MQQYYIRVLDRGSQYVLRLMSQDDRWLGEREFFLKEIKDFLEEIIAEQTLPSEHLKRLGSCLYEWLDGSEDRWLASILQNSPGLTLYIESESLCRLPWELLCRNNCFLCSNELCPFTPVRLVTDEKHTVMRANRI